MERGCIFSTSLYKKNLLVVYIIRKILVIMNSIKICVIGLGYVGLPLARLFSTKYKTVGFDMNKARVDALMAGHDATL